MTSELPKISVAETLADKIVALKSGVLPETTTRKCEDLLIDVVGLCVTARNEDYIASALAGWDDDGPCTVIGHQRTLNASGGSPIFGACFCVCARVGRASTTALALTAAAKTEWRPVTYSRIIVVTPDVFVSYCMPAMARASPVTSRMCMPVFERSTT